MYQLHYCPCWLFDVLIADRCKCCSRCSMRPWEQFWDLSRSERDNGNAPCSKIVILSWTILLLIITPTTKEEQVKTSESLMNTKLAVRPPVQRGPLTPHTKMFFIILYSQLLIRVQNSNILQLAHILKMIEFYQQVPW